LLESLERFSNVLNNLGMNVLRSALTTGKQLQMMPTEASMMEYRPGST
jgi:hypothetical protein